MTLIRTHPSRRGTWLRIAGIASATCGLVPTLAWAQLGVFPFLRIDGGPTGAHLGAAVAVGDFNNDGFDDLAMGEPDRQFDGTLDVGLVRILYGGNGALLATDGILPNEVPGGVIESGADFGAALASGDFNGDDFDDLAIGSPGKLVNGFDNAGALTIIYGGSGGLDPASGAIFDQRSLIGGPEAGDQLGASLAVGNLNGDAFADLAAGLPGEDFGGVNDAGAVSVLFGSMDGLTTADDQFLALDANGVDGVAGNGDAFGAALAIGGFNGDPIVDLAVGIPGMADPDGGGDGAGGVRVFPGSVQGIDLSGSEPLYFQGTPGLLGTPGADDAFGAALLASDFNGDGQFDLAIGVPGEDEFGTNQSGAVQILYGANIVGLQTSNDQFFFEGLFDTDVDAFDRFGTALASGDFNDDGRDDLAIGAPLDNSLGFVNAGEVSILYGTETGLSVVGAQLANMIFFDELVAGDTFGAALAAGRFTDRIGGDDLAIGVPNVVSNGNAQAGAVLILFSEFPFVDEFEDGSLSRWDTSVP